MKTSEDTIAPRPAVVWFAQQMETKLQENDHKAGWAGLSDAWIMNRIR